MTAAILTVSEKVLVLFLMMGVGYGCFKLRVITTRGSAQLTNLLLYVIGPCLIVSALQTDSGGISMGEILLTVFLFLAGLIVLALSSQLLFRDQQKDRAGLLRYGVIYSNCAFMGLPLVQSILGSQGVVYASACVVAFNLMTWTHGYLSMGGGGGTRAQMVKKALLNPGTLSFAVALPLYALSIKLPPVLLQPIDSIGQMNTPLAMIVVGTYLAKLDLRQIFSDRHVYVVSLLRLLAVPFAFLFLLLLVHPEPNMMVTLAVLMGAPAAANGVLFATKFRRDAELACKMIALTTLLSIITMPVLAVAAQNLAGVL